MDDGSLAAEDLGGALLDGVDPPGCPGFDSWLLLARARYAVRTREELRARALGLLARGDAETALAVAGRAAGLDVLDEQAQELFLRSLVAAGHAAQASVHLATCTAAFAREGLTPSAALRDAASVRGPGPPSGMRAGVVARSLLRAGTAAIAAGAADAGVETLRRAAEEAERARDPALLSEVLTALGSALVHAVRGFDGEGAVVLGRALLTARSAERPALAAEVLRELAFVDVQAGRHASAARALREAAEQAGTLRDDALAAGVLAVRGMNEADRGRHAAAATLLAESAQRAARRGHGRQQAWSLGLLARSLLLAGHAERACEVATESIAIVQQERWTAFLPWPQVLRAQATSELGDWDTAGAEAESAFALACELGDPCWEGMAARALALAALHVGDVGSARRWVTDARRRCDRVSDRYVWVSGYIGLADLELSVHEGAGAAAAAAVRLRDDAVRADLPEFLAWALVHQAESGVDGRLPLARAAADGIDNPRLQARLSALG